MEGQILTNSSNTTKRRDLDFYPTPPEVTQGLVNTGLIPNGSIWEPCCGDGDMSEVLKQTNGEVFSSDIRDTGYQDKVLDFRKVVEDAYSFKSIITNPPFMLSEEFIRISVDRADFVAVLLKSQYWHAKKRADLFDQYPPAYVYKLTWRPDFMFKERKKLIYTSSEDSAAYLKKKGSPTMECEWTIWIKGDYNTKLRLMHKPT